MRRVRIHIRAILLVLIAVMIPALGFAAHQQHEHPEANPHPREATHSHHHGDADAEAEHDHLPVKSFLDLVAAPGSRAVIDCDIAPLSANDHDRNSMNSRGVSAANIATVVDYSDPPPLPESRTTVLRFAANLPPPSVS